MSRKGVFIGLLFLGAVAGISSAYAMYSGSPDWKAPKVLSCDGLPAFPDGMKIEPSEVYGASFDRYIFSTLDGAMGIYYFDMEYPASFNVIKGFASYLERKDGPNTAWSSKDYAVTCKVSDWEK